jgi:ATP-dependent Clp protease ATP-binding subunit ClpX
MNVMFELPSRDDVRKCVVTRETIEKSLPPTLVTEATHVEDEEPPAIAAAGS